ncbi:DNA N-6-adenine-methyltransferase [Nocardioides sp.]|uniref:DNA N-6-adenine-methyltransferase n=1 Tax=Nocardioides sp. TaxID=35761 RepID=UPI00321BB1D4
MYSSASDDWPTPAAFYDRLDAEFNFVLDVCASATNHKAPEFYALDHPDTDRRDGLAADWAADARSVSGIEQPSLWMNPPYGRPIRTWMSKARTAARAGCVVVCLVPVRADTRWWHDLVLATGAEVRYVRGRLTFGDATTSAPFASAVVIYRPDDTPGAPGSVGVIAAKPLAPQHDPVEELDAVATYVNSYTPRRLTTEQWALAAEPVRALVRQAEPVSLAEARLLLSHLCGLLADQHVWDGSSVPDLPALLRTASVNEHLARTKFGTPKSFTARQSSLQRVGRVLGVCEPVAKKYRYRQHRLDQFLLTASQLPLSFVDTVTAWRATGRRPLSLDPLGDIARHQRGHRPGARAWSAATAVEDPAVTVMSSALIRALTEANHSDFTVTPSNQPHRSGIARESRAAANRPTSRRARLAAAKAAHTERTARDAFVPTVAMFPVSDDVRAAFDSFVGAKSRRGAWKANLDLARLMVFAAQQPSPRSTQTACSHVAAYLTWLAARHDATTLTVEHVTAPGAIEDFIAQTTWADASKSTARSMLRRCTRPLDPSSKPMTLTYARVNPPYTSEECEQFVRLASVQPTTAKARDLGFIIGLSLGAGLDARDLRELTRESFTDAHLGGEPVLLVSVPGKGPRARTVPVRHAHAPLVRRSLALHASTGKEPGDLLLGKVADRNNVVGPATSRARSAESTERVEVSMSRLRATWMVALMCAPVSVADALATAGLASSRTMIDLLSFCPPPTGSRIEQVQTAVAAADTTPASS